jgi:hypothetical protein
LNFLIDEIEIAAIDEELTKRRINQLLETLFPKILRVLEGKCFGQRVRFFQLCKSLAEKLCRHANLSDSSNSADSTDADIVDSIKSYLETLRGSNEGSIHSDRQHCYNFVLEAVAGSDISSNKLSNRLGIRWNTIESARERRAALQVKLSEVTVTDSNSECSEEDRGSDLEDYITESCRKRKREERQDSNREESMELVREYSHFVGRIDTFSTRKRSKIVIRPFTTALGQGVKLEKHEVKIRPDSINNMYRGFLEWEPYINY